MRREVGISDLAVICKQHLGLSGSCGFRFSVNSKHGTSVPADPFVPEKHHMASDAKRSKTSQRFSKKKHLHTKCLLRTAQGEMQPFLHMHVSTLATPVSARTQWNFLYKYAKKRLSNIKARSKNISGIKKHNLIRKTNQL